MAFRHGYPIPSIQPMLVAMAGLPASGKSTLARLLSASLPAVLLDKDTVRACLFSEYVDYSREQNDLCVDVIYNVAEYILDHNPEVNIILDGRTYSRRYQIKALKQLADKLQIRPYIIECVCSEASAKTRLEQQQNSHIAEDRDFNLYLQSRTQSEAIDEPKLLVDTDRESIEGCVDLTMNYLQDSL